MRIGIPTEVKTLEGRVALIPAAVGQLVSAGHEVCVQQGAGNKSGYPDEQFQQAGARLAENAEQLYAETTLIVKVKEPQVQELPLLRREHMLFSYLHLAAAPELMASLQEIGLTAIALETVETEQRQLPLLAPMSDIAGRIAAQVGTHLLYQPQGGKGILLGGVPAAERGRVVVLGAGTAGGAATTIVAALGAEVTVFDRNRDKLERMRALGNNVTGLYPYPDALHEAAVKADMIIGAVLVTGERAPHLVSADTVREMGAGSVILDISVDQGGCIETTRPTTYDAPTFVWEGVTHFGVTNMPGAVPRTASQALCASLIPYVLRLAETDWREDASLQRGINLENGQIVHPALQELVI